MTHKEDTRIFSDEEIKMRIIEETAAAFLYSDEEIRETFSPEDAEEFIEQRNLAISYLKGERRIKPYTDEAATPLAAEEQAAYK